MSSSRSYKDYVKHKVVSRKLNVRQTLNREYLKEITSLILEDTNLKMETKIRQHYYFAKEYPYKQTLPLAMMILREFQSLITNTDINIHMGNLLVDLELLTQDSEIYKFVIVFVYKESFIKYNKEHRGSPADNVKNMFKAAIDLVKNRIQHDDNFVDIPLKISLIITDKTDSIMYQSKNTPKNSMH